MKQSAIVLATLVLLGGALYLSQTVRPTPNSVESPAICLERMFQAAEQGDVEAYLACFTGQQRQRLAGEGESQPRADFAASLRAALGELKGRAISGSLKIPPDAQRATLAVERVYERHAERQDYHFVRDSAGWRIESVGQVQEFQPPIPYGTPVYEQN